MILNRCSVGVWGLWKGKGWGGGRYGEVRKPGTELGENEANFLCRYYEDRDESSDGIEKKDDRRNIEEQIS